MLLWLFVACIFTTAATAAASICPENSQEWELKCYLFVSNNSAFINAEIHCRSFGGHLASISNAFTNAFIAQQAGYLLQGSGTPDAWLGGTSLIDATNWTWTDHQPFTFANWANSSAVKEHTCTAIGLANGLWMSDDCFETKPYICIIDSNTEPVTTSTPTPTTPAAAESTLTSMSPIFTSTTSSSFSETSTTTEIATTPESTETNTFPSTTASPSISAISTTNKITTASSSSTAPITTETDASVFTTVTTPSLSSESATKTIPLESTTSFFTSTVIATTDAKTTTTTDEADITSSATSSGFSSTNSTTPVSQTTVPSLTTPLFSTSVKTDSTVTSTSVFTTVTTSSSSSETTTKTIPLESTTSFYPSTIKSTTDGKMTALTDESSSSTKSTPTPTTTEITTITSTPSTTPLTTEFTVTSTSASSISTTSLDETSITKEITTTTSTPSTTPFNPCPQNWTYFISTSACYLSLSSELSWNDAENFCLTQNAHLASIHSKAELYFIQDINLATSWNRWIGLHKIDEEWRWTDDSPKDYFDWQNGNPQSYDYTCVNLLYAFWNDKACDDHLGAVCKMLV